MEILVPDFLLHSHNLKPIKAKFGFFDLVQSLQIRVQLCRFRRPPLIRREAAEQEVTSVSQHRVKQAITDTKNTYIKRKIDFPSDSLFSDKIMDSLSNLSLEKMMRRRIIIFLLCIIYSRSERITRQLVKRKPTKCSIADFQESYITSMVRFGWSQS